jgi:hypothetical protein
VLNAAHLPPGSRFRRAPNLVTRAIGGETIIVPVSGMVGDLDSIYTLNGVGSLIWSLLDGQRGLQDIVRGVTGEFEVAEDEAARDVQGFLDSLGDAGLVQACPEG